MLFTNIFLKITTEISGMRLSSWEIIWSSANIYYNRREWTNILHTVLYMGLHKVCSKLYPVTLNSSHGQNFDRYIVGLILFQMVPDAWKLLPEETFYCKKWRDSTCGCKSSFASVGIHFMYQFIHQYVPTVSLCMLLKYLFHFIFSWTVLCHIS